MTIAGLYQNDIVFSRNLHNSIHKTYIFDCYYIGTAKDNTLC